jgi:hypothetical protein
MGPLPVLLFFVIGQSQDPSVTAPNDVPPPITGIGRLDWAVKSTIGPASLWTGVLNSTWGTAFNHPREYGESFEGFAKRYGLRLTGVAASNVTEAGLGALWGEDPRYHRDRAEAFRSRFHRTLKMTFLSETRDGRLTPAYARYIAIAGTNVLSDAWRPNSDRGPVNTIDRIGMGFGGRLLGNMWEEFWPDVRKHVFFLKH